MVKKYNDEDPIKDLGDFTNGWTYDKDLGDDDGILLFSNPNQVAKYVLDNIHKPGIYEFAFKKKRYQINIQISLKELIV